MSAQPMLFDLINPELEDSKRDYGKARAAAHRADVLAQGQAVALEIGRARGECSADDVYAALAARGVDTSTLGPAAGSLFDASQWVFVRWQKSRRPGNHARSIRVWGLR